MSKGSKQQVTSNNSNNSNNVVYIEKEYVYMYIYTAPSICYYRWQFVSLSIYVYACISLAGILGHVRCSSHSFKLAFGQY